MADACGESWAERQAEHPEVWELGMELGDTSHQILESSMLRVQSGGSGTGDLRVGRFALGIGTCPLLGSSLCHPAAYNIK